MKKEETIGTVTRSRSKKQNDFDPDYHLDSDTESEGKDEVVSMATKKDRQCRRGKKDVQDAVNSNVSKRSKKLSREKQSKTHKTKKKKHRASKQRSLVRQIPVKKVLHPRNLFVPNCHKQTCHICSSVFSSHAHLRRHVVSCDPSSFAKRSKQLFLVKKARQISWFKTCCLAEEGNNMWYVCKLCSRQFRRSSILSVHLVKKHSRKMGMKLHWIRFYCSSRQLVKDTTKLAKNRKELKEIQNLFTSLKCVKGKKKREKGKATECKYCGKGFVTKSSLRTHMRNIHRELEGDECKKPRLPDTPLFQCFQCRASLKSKACLVAHFRVRNFVSQYGPEIPKNYLQIILHFSKEMVAQFLHAEYLCLGEVLMINYL